MLLSFSNSVSAGDTSLADGPILTQLAAAQPPQLLSVHLTHQPGLARHFLKSGPIWPNARAALTASSLKSDLPAFLQVDNAMNTNGVGAGRDGPI